jgi:phosphatidylserine/phosphatidylglycerophosphate/cardiolipin synthase-like enzyme
MIIRRIPLLGLGVLLASLILLQTLFAADTSRNVAPPHGPVQVTVSACFVPAQSCVDSIVNAIGAAKDSIRVQAYGFTSTPILSALAGAKRRGVNVEVILDKSNDRTSRNGAASGDDEVGRQPRGNRYTGATYMANAGVPVFIDFQPAIAHNKVIVIDSHLVIGGSYNYTASAERRNAENVTFIDSPEVAGWYLKNWQSRKEVSRTFRDTSP